jgi:hypothetical protein
MGDAGVAGTAMDSPQGEKTARKPRRLWTSSGLAVRNASRTSAIIIIEIRIHLPSAPGLPGHAGCGQQGIYAG